MKKIGLLFGMDKSFPQELMNKINSMNLKDISAEFIKIGGMNMTEFLNYNVIFDRVSNEVPFYRSILKCASLNGSRVVNNPFWICADDNFFHACLATKMGIELPKTAIIPSKAHPVGSSAESMQNLVYPLNWDDIFNYVGFPAYIKPDIENAEYNPYKVYNSQEFFSAYDMTGHNVMILQEAIEFEDYFRCFVIGRKHVRIIRYDPRRPMHLRYSAENPVIEDSLHTEMEKRAIKISTALGFDFNAVDIAVRDGVPVITDFLNAMPRVERTIVHDANFDWLVAKTAGYLTDLAREGKYKPAEHTWSMFLRGPKSGGKRIKRSGLSKKSKKEINVDDSGNFS